MATSARRSCGRGRGWSICRRSGDDRSIFIGQTASPAWTGAKWYITPPSFPGIANAAQELLPPHGLRRAVGAAVVGSLPAPAAAAADPNKVIRWFFPTGENGFDPVAHLGSLFGHDPRGDLRAAAHLRLPRAARRRSCRWPPRRCRWSPTNGKTWTFKITQGHPFRARSRVQGQEARAHRAGLRLLVHAVHGSEEPLALRVPARGQDRRPGRARREGEADGQVRLRRQGRRAWRRSTATRCASG